MGERVSALTWVRERYPRRIPVICERKQGCHTIADVERHKYLLPADLLVQHFVCVLRKRLSLDYHTSIFVFCDDGTIPPNTARMDLLYQARKHDDGYLYLFYTGENVFGGRPAR